MRPADELEAPFYFCAKHARPGDLEIPRERRFRRVQLILEILVAGTSSDAGLAELDALSRTIAAVESVGGIVSVFQVSSQIGQTAGQAPWPGGNGKAPHG